jgi:hypothetical protein
MQSSENGLKILARMIAEAYLEELARKPTEQALPIEKKGYHYAYQVCDQDFQIARLEPVHETPASLLTTEKER